MYGPQLEIQWLLFYISGLSDFSQRMNVSSYASFSSTERSLVGIHFTAEVGFTNLAQVGLIQTFQKMFTNSIYFQSISQVEVQKWPSFKMGYYKTFEKCGLQLPFNRQWQLN